MSERTSGILLPIFSLPGRYGIGCLSKEAYDFVRYLKKAHQTYWQILPVGPTSYGDSPYQSFSTFAGNPYFISLDELIKRGYLTREECEAADLGDSDTDIDYGKLYRNRYPLLRKAFDRSGAAKDKHLKRFVKKNREWIYDYAKFMAIKDSYGGAPFGEWDEGLKLHDEKALARFTKVHKKDILFYAWLQYEFFREWSRFKRFANKHGIQIIGDIPIYVSPDSADVWANPELFQMDTDMNPTRVAGCPPDGFSADGQLWGNPLYDWPYHKRTGYRWWISRMKACADMYDVVRIDHFRGFDEYYSIRFGDDNAREGRWEEGPGIALFDAIEKKLGRINVIAEDLGFVTETVRKLVDDTGYPGMKVLEFAFDDRDQKSGSGPNDYLPYMYGANSVVYTGTHDNETLVGFLQGAPKGVKKEIKRFLGLKRAGDVKIAKELVRTAMASPANMCVIPMQDYLGLDNSARINEPSTLGQNWRWRMEKRYLTAKLAKRMRQLSDTYYRD